MAFLFAFSTQTFAVNFTVNQAGDTGDFICDATCTLRDAVDDANAAGTDDTISFAAGLTTITLTGQIQTNNAGTLTITGAGANVLTINGGAGANRIFFVNGATVTIRGVTLTGGNGEGAAVFANSSTVILEEVVVQNNVGGSASSGAVYFNGGTNHRIANSTFSGNTDFTDCAAFRAENTSLTVVNTTVSGNSTNASSFGAGAICIVGGTATFRSTTISGNTANGTGGGGGGGIYIQGTATVNLGNTIVAGNTAAGPGPDLFRFGSTATFTTSGGNLIGDNSGSATNPNTGTFPTGNPNANGDKVGTAGSVINPLLGPLTISNGGTTPTRALLSGSPAIDSGVNTLATAAGLTTDQRGIGFSRIVDGNGDGTAIVDIGAFEVQVAPTAATVSVSGRVTARGRGISNAVVHLTSQSGEIQTAKTNRLGYYTFTELAAGETYIFNVFSKRYQFNPQVVNLTEDLDELNFTAQ